MSGNVWGEAPKTVQGTKNYWDNQSSSDIPIQSIKTISDNNTGLVAPPTAYVGHQVADLEHLNQKLVIPTKTEGGIDLSLLTSIVKPLEVVYEKDEAWDYQHLIIEVAQVIRSQKGEPPKVIEEPEPINEYSMLPYEENS